ncbi:MAG: hypothetical protein M3237_09125 [Actinomycetota bacterium]|nr:hypothetical protein [Actinomycetota bacterium]
MSPLPPSDVRRQGDRLRRRHTALAGIGAALAVALIATPIAVLSAGDDGDAGPDPAPPPSYGVDWRQSIPDGFPLDEGMTADINIPARVGTEVGSSQMVLPAINICGADVWSSDDAVDLLGAVWSDRVEGGEKRTLALYPDDGTAEKSLLAMTRAVDECRVAEPGDVTYWLSLRSELGEQSFAWVEQFHRGGEPNGTRVWQVARVGNALLLDQTDVPEADPAVSQEAADLLADRASGVIDAMCVFSADGCETSEPSPSETVEPPSGATGSGEVPEDFPLAAGWPKDSEPGRRYGLTGPSASLEPFDLAACGASVPTPAATGVLRARWANPEDYRSRELYAFSDADAAVRFIDDVVDFYSGCPREDTGDGFTTVRQVRMTGVGGQSYAVIQTSEFDGAPAVGMQVVHLIRVGHAVLIDVAANEGGAGPDLEADSQGQIDAQTTATADVVAAMCRFTEAGCG